MFRLQLKVMIFSVNLFYLSFTANAQISFINGKVIDATTQELIPNAQLRLRHLPSRVYSDSLGRFELDNVPFGVVELMVNKVGYQPINIRANIKSRGNAIVVKLEKRAKVDITTLIKELNHYREKISVVTDKDYYYPGEIIWLKSFVNHIDPTKRDSLSRVIYIDFISKEKKIVSRHILSLDSGRFAGSIQLPEDMVPGNYLLKAYTRFMLNFGEDNFFSQVIPILATNQRVLPTISKKPILRGSEVSILKDKSSYGLRDKVTLQLQISNSSMTNGIFSISVQDMSQVIPIVSSTFVSEWGFDPGIDEDSFFEPKSVVEKGVRCTGRFVNEYITGKEAILNVYRSDYSEMMDFKTDEKGWFQINGLKFYDSAIFFYKAKTVKKSKNLYGKIVLNKDYDPIIGDVFFPGIWFKTENTESPKRLLSDYLRPINSKMLEEVEIKSTKIERQDPTRSILGGADNTIEVKDLVNFGDLLLSLQGKVPGLIISCATTPCTVRFSRSIGSTISGSTEPLVLINGSPASGAAGDIISSIDVNMVEKVEFSKRLNVLYGEQGRNGIIAIFLKDGMDQYSSITDINYSFILKGFTRPLEFVNPNYGSNEQESSMADYRSTIYWNPELEQNPKTKKYECSFYTSDIHGKYRIVVQGVTAGGRPVWVEDFIDVN